MQACRAALQAPLRVGLGRPGAGRAAPRSAPTSARPRLLVAPGAGPAQQHTTGQRQLSVVAAAKAGGGGDGGSGRKTPGPKSHEPNPQPELQAWLEQKGLGPADADQHARRLARVFGGDQQAALASLPATFAFCGRKGLSALQTAELLDGIAKQRRDNVVSFAATAQDWQLIGDCTAAYVQRLQQAGKRLPKHTSLTSLLVSTKEAHRMLAHPPGHVAAWLDAVSTQMPDPADVGHVLLTNPRTLGASTTAAVLSWFVDTLGVQPAQLAAFAARAPTLLQRNVQSLQCNLDALQKALPPQLAMQLVGKEPILLSSSSDTVQQALAWLQRQFDGNAARLSAVLRREPLVLAVPADKLQRRADFLQRQPGWQPGDGQLVAWIEAHPRAMAKTDFDSEDKQALLLLFTRVVGADLADCLGRWSVYLGRGLEVTAARYTLVQERAPHLLRDRHGNGGPRLIWAVDAPKLLPACGAATKAEVLEFETAWPKSEQGQRLLAALRSGSIQGWPLPPTAEEAK